MRRWLAWACATVTVIATGSFGLRAITHHTVPTPDARFSPRFDLGLGLPFPVVMDSPRAWLFLFVFFATIAALTLCARMLLKELAAHRSDTLVPFYACVAVVLCVMSGFSTLFSLDAYAYVFFGRIYGLYAVNPYVGASRASWPDPTTQTLANFLGSPQPADNYGPLWTLIAGKIAYVEGPASLGFQVWTVRVLAALAVLAGTAALMRIMRTIPLASRVRSAGAFALHPLVLYESAAAGHNDMLMIAPVLWAFALVDESAIAAGLLAGIGIAIKYVALIALPFLLLRSWRHGFTQSLLVAGCALLVPVCSFIPLWRGPSTLATLLQFKAFKIASPLWLAATWLPKAFSHVVEVCVFAGVVIIIAACVIADARKLDCGHVYGSLTALLWGAPVINPWYVQWLMPALASRSRWALYSFWFGLLVLLRYVQDAVRYPADPAGVRQMLIILTGVTLVFLLVPLGVTFAQPKVSGDAANLASYGT